MERTAQFLSARGKFGNPLAELVGKFAKLAAGVSSELRDGLRLSVELIAGEVLARRFLGGSGRGECRPSSSASRTTDRSVTWSRWTDTGTWAAFAWVFPRLHGRAKAAMAAVEFDEFGAGRADEIHAKLFAALMEDLRLDTRYGHAVDAAPAEALATVNLMSLFGLHRALRAALVGHFATVE